jgi:hypothetical protein
MDCIGIAPILAAIPPEPFAGCLYILYNFIHGYGRAEPVVNHCYQSAAIHQPFGQIAKVAFVHRAPIASMDKNMYGSLWPSRHEQIQRLTLTAAIRYLQFTYAPPSVVGTTSPPVLEKLFMVRNRGPGVVLFLQLFRRVSPEDSCVHDILIFVVATL